MSEKDVVEKLLEKYPGLRLMHKISFEQKNWINKHILAAKFAVFNIRDQTLTNEEQITYIERECNYIGLNIDLFDALKRNFLKIQASKIQTKFRNEEDLRKAREYLQHQQELSRRKYTGAASSRISFNKDISMTSLNKKTSPKNFKISRKSSSRPSRSQILIQTSAKMSVQQYLKETKPTDASISYNQFASVEKLTLAQQSLISASNNNFFITSSTHGHEQRGTNKLKPLKQAPAIDIDREVIKPYLMDNKSDIYKKVIYPRMAKTYRPVYAGPGRISEVTKARNQSSVLYKDFVKLHSKGYSSLENYDFFFHLKRMLPIMKIYKMYGFNNEFKYKNFDIRFGNEDLSPREEVFFRSLFMKRLVIGEGKNMLLGIKRIIQLLEKNKSKGGVVAGDVILDEQRDNKQSKVIGYSKDRFKEENQFISAALQKFKLITPTELYRVKNIVDNRLGILNSLEEDFSINKQLEEFRAKAKKTKSNLTRTVEISTVQNEKNLDFLEDLLQAQRLVFRKNKEEYKKQLAHIAKYTNRKKKAKANLDDSMETVSSEDSFTLQKARSEKVASKKALIDRESTKLRFYTYALKEVKRIRAAGRAIDNTQSSNPNAPIYRSHGLSAEFLESLKNHAPDIPINIRKEIVAILSIEQLEGLGEEFEDEYKLALKQSKLSGIDNARHYTHPNKRQIHTLPSEAKYAEDDKPLNEQISQRKHYTINSKRRGSKRRVSKKKARYNLDKTEIKEDSKGIKCAYIEEVNQDGEVTKKKVSLDEYNKIVQSVGQEESSLASSMFNSEDNENIQDNQEQVMGSKRRRKLQKGGDQKETAQKRKTNKEINKDYKGSKLKNQSNQPNEQFSESKFESVHTNMNSNTQFEKSNSLSKPIDFKRFGVQEDDYEELRFEYKSSKMRVTKPKVYLAERGYMPSLRLVKGIRRANPYHDKKHQRPSSTHKLDPVEQISLNLPSSPSRMKRSKSSMNFAEQNFESKQDELKIRENAEPPNVREVLDSLVEWSRQLLIKKKKKKRRARRNQLQAKGIDEGQVDEEIESFSDSDENEEPRISRNPQVDQRANNDAASKRKDARKNLNAPKIGLNVEEAQERENTLNSFESGQTYEIDPSIANTDSLYNTAQNLRNKRDKRERKIPVENNVYGKNDSNKAPPVLTPSDPSSNILKSQLQSTKKNSDQDIAREQSGVLEHSTTSILGAKTKTGDGAQANSSIPKKLGEVSENLEFLEVAEPTRGDISSEYTQVTPEMPNSVPRFENEEPSISTSKKFSMTVEKLRKGKKKGTKKGKKKVDAVKGNPNFKGSGKGSPGSGDSVIDKTDNNNNKKRIGPVARMPDSSKKRIKPVIKIASNKELPSQNSPLKPGNATPLSIPPSTFRKKGKDGKRGKKVVEVSELSVSKQTEDGVEGAKPKNTLPVLKTAEEKYNYYLYSHLSSQNKQIAKSVEDSLIDKLLMKRNCEDELKEFFGGKISDIYKRSNYRMKFTSDISIPSFVDTKSNRTRLERAHKMGGNLEGIPENEGFAGVEYQYKEDAFFERKKLFWEQIEFIEDVFGRIEKKIGIVVEDDEPPIHEDYRVQNTESPIEVQKQGDPTELKSQADLVPNVSTNQELETRRKRDWFRLIKRKLRRIAKEDRDRFEEFVGFAHWIIEESEYDSGVEEFAD